MVKGADGRQLSIGSWLLKKDNLIKF